eukprot:EG_transcript_16624
MPEAVAPDLHQLFFPPPAPALPYDVPGFAVVGPAQCGKSHLAFTFAINRALRGSRVVIIGSRAKMEASPPGLPAGLALPDAAPALQAIAMKYLPHDSALCQYLLALPLLSAAETPTTVVIDDLWALFVGSPRPPPRSVIRCLALLNDTMRWAAARTQRSACYLIVDDLDGPLHSGVPSALHRWLPLTLQLALENDDERDEAGHAAPPAAPAGRHLTAVPAPSVGVALPRARLHYRIVAGGAQYVCTDHMAATPG